MDTSSINNDVQQKIEIQSIPVKTKASIDKFQYKPPDLLIELLENCKCLKQKKLKCEFDNCLIF